METTDIIRRMQAEIDALNFALMARDAEIARLTACIEQRHAVVGGLMGEVARAALAAPFVQAPLDEIKLDRIIGRLAGKHLSIIFEPDEINEFALDLIREVRAIDAAHPAKVQGAATEQLIRAFNSGYKSGHHDTVEGNYTDIDQRDMFTYHAEVIAEMIADGTLAGAAVPPIPAPIEAAKKPMTYDEFFAEAERTGLIDALIPGVVARLGEMEAQGVIRKHEDGGYEFVAPTEAAEAGSIGDDPEFDNLLDKFAMAANCDFDEGEARDQLHTELVAYIDSFFAARIAAREVLTGWISVEDRLPLENELVAILFWPYDNHENAQIVGSATHIDGSFFNHEGDDCHPPSHWAPLPAIESAIAVHVSPQSGAADTASQS